jgi:hypothetical protein
VAWTVVAGDGVAVDIMGSFNFVRSEFQNCLPPEHSEGGGMNCNSPIPRFCNFR